MKKQLFILIALFVIINAHAQIDLSGPGITLDILDGTYNGNEQIPGIVTIRENGNTLFLNRDFSVGWDVSQELRNVGTKTIKIIGSSLGGYSGEVTKTWVIQPRPVTVTAKGGSSIYGESPINPNFTATNLSMFHNESVLTGLYNNFGISSTTSAGSHTLSVMGTLTNNNYIIVTSTPGTWTVNPKSITVTANGGSSTYGESPANPGFTATGLVNSETQSVLTGLSNSFGIDATTPPGTYTLSVDGPLTNNNYTIDPRTPGTWTVNPKSITVTANGGSSTYGESPANPGLTATGLANGETESVLTGLSNSFGIDATTPPGIYTLSIDGTLTNSNYTIGTRNTGTWIVRPTVTTLITQPQGASICQGGSHTFIIEVEGTNLQYQWYKGSDPINGATGNEYTVNNATSDDHAHYYVTVNGDDGQVLTSNTATLWIANPLPGILSFEELPATALVGKYYPVRLKAYEDATNYDWSYSAPGATFSPLIGRINETMVSFSSAALGTGILSVELTHVCGNQTVTAPITVQYQTGIEDIEASEARLYPNPVADELQIENKRHAIKKVIVTDVNGRIIYNEQPNTTYYRLSVRNWTKGIYFVRITTEAGTTTQKVVKK